MSPHFITISLVIFGLLKSSSGASIASQNTVKEGARELKKSQVQGGSDGVPFDDLADFSTGDVVGIHNISICSVNQIATIQVIYILLNGSYHQGPLHGGTCSGIINITLSSEEFVTKIEGRTNGEFVDQLTIHTIGPQYERKVYGPFGSNGTQYFAFEGYITGFHGSSGHHLNSIGVYSFEALKKSAYFGGDGGSPYDDTADLVVPPIIRLSRLNIWNGELVDAIQAEYVQFGGKITLGTKHGEGGSMNLTTIIFTDGEEIIGLEGQTGDHFVDQITIKTRLRDGSQASYGPFGRIGKHPFSVYGTIFGFFGNAGKMMDGIGVYII